MWNDDQERRRYFRITDQVAISYRLLSETDNVITGVNINAPAALIVQLENQITASLETMRSIQPQVHEVLELFNRKINLILSLDDTLSEPIAEREKRPNQVNISACGIAFPTPEKFKPNDRILLDLTLFPSNLCLKLIAVVIGSDELPESIGEDNYMVRADFIDITSNVQEALVQHIIKRQTLLLKERRVARQEKK